MAAIGSSTFLIPLLYLTYQSPSLLQLDIVKSLLLFIPVTSTIAIAVLPQWWLSEVVCSTRAESLRRLKEKLPAKISEVDDWSSRELAGLVSLIKLVGDSPSTTVNDRTVAALLLGAATALLPYFIQFSF